MKLIRLSASNIAWKVENDSEMLNFLSTLGFAGLEIAPTRVIPQQPYEQLGPAREFSRRLNEVYGLSVSAMQSIYYGVGGSIYDGGLLDYTKSAVDFAVAVGCPIIVFGCPKHRNIPEGVTGAWDMAGEFFSKIVEYSRPSGTVIAIEPNPPIYGTNFINTTEEAIRFCGEVKGLKVNFDMGTVIENNEPVSDLELVSHVHVSEPFLVPIVRRDLHGEVNRKIKSTGYSGFVSLEMRDPGDLSVVKEALEYVKEVFGGMLDDD